MPGMGRVHTGLVGTAGEEFDLHQRRTGLGVARTRVEYACRRFTLLAGLHHTFTATFVLFQRRDNGPLTATPQPPYQREVALGDATSLKRLVQPE